MKSVKRVENKKALELTIEDKQTEGYKLASSTDYQAAMYKNNYGSFVGHIIVFVLFGWWTLFVANLLYMLICFFAKKEELIIKVGKI